MTIDLIAVTHHRIYCASDAEQSVDFTVDDYGFATLRGYWRDGVRTDLSQCPVTAEELVEALESAGGGL